LADLIRALSVKERVYSLDGPQMLTVKLPDNTFRKKNVLGMEFYPQDARVGARDTIFCFTPEDPQEFSTVEVGSKQMDAAFPMFLEDVKEWAIERFKSGGASRETNIAKCARFDDLVGIVFSMASEDSKNEAAVVDDELASHPLFGMF
ncbi:hypothetical protein HGG70_07405, partial [Rhodobacteraceae bacterium R_SAG4]|nr:hypothetical protein [Rhodobacteraceae bacterium R_SAG4]